MEQLSIFDFTRQPFKIDKPIRLISLFSGYDSQAMALKRLGVNFEHYRAVEFDKYAMASLNAVHGTSFEPTDICDVTGKDLNIIHTYIHTYIHGYLLVSLSKFIFGRQTSRHSKRQRHTFGTFMGSRKITQGM